MPRQLIVASACLSALATADRPATAQVFADPYQSSIALLEQATRAQPDGSHLPLLFALRQLRDPDLQGLFLQLAQRSGETRQWPMQVHAVLGLAEISAEHRIDPWMITQIEPQAQEAVIASALDSELLPSSMIPEILQLDQLSAMARLFLLAERVSLGETVDQEELKRLAPADDLHSAGLAAALLAQVGSTQEFSTFDSRLNDQPAAERHAVTQWLMDGARRYKLSAMNDWIASSLADPRTDPDVLYRGTLALLSLDPARGIPAWERFLGAQPTLPHRVRCGIMLLAARELASVAAFDKLLPAGEGEELVARIVDVGKAIVSKSDPADSLIALLDIGHAKSSLWAMEYLKQMPAEHRRPVLEYLIDRLAELKPSWTEAIGQAVEATSMLFELDPDGVLRRLQEAEDDSALQQALLLGLFEVNSDRIGGAARLLPRIGSGRADSLVLLLMAKHSADLSPEDLNHLGTIAAGGGRVSQVLQVQAAWLYLKRSGKTDQALAAVFAKTD